MTIWEYTEVTEPTIRLNAFMQRLNAHGSLGWEVVAIAAADPTLGMNSYTAILKRTAHEYPAPDDKSAAWLPDPAGRFQKRFWDGTRWTKHVTTDGVQSIDFPIVR